MSDDGWLETPDRALHELTIGTGDYLAASAAQSAAESPLAELGRMAGLAHAARMAGPDVPVDQAREQVRAAGLDGVLHVDGVSIKQPVLDLMIANAREKREREVTIARGPSGIVPNALAAGTSFLAGALDPINIGATMIPFVGEARAARLLAGAGENFFARAAVRVGIGGVQGAAGMVPIEGLNWLDHTMEGQDWYMADALRGIAFGGVLGAGLHAGLGALADRAAPRPGDPIEAAVEHIKAAEDAWTEAAAASETGPVLSDAAPGAPQGPARAPADSPIAAKGRDEIAAQVADLPPQAREDAARATLGTLVDGRPVRTADMLAAAAEHDPRISESVALPPLHEGVTITERGGPLGPVLDGLQGRWRDAVAWLRQARTGDARGVLSHPDVPAPIDVVWGDTHGGLAHILARHPEVVDVLPDRLARMRVVQRSENRIRLTDGEYTAVIRRDHDGKAKTWLLTAFEGVPDGVPRSGRGSTGSPSELRGPLTSRAAPGDANVNPDADGVETARDASANFRRLAADHLPHNEPEVVAASRAAAARWEDDRASNRESAGATGESSPTPEPAAESPQAKESGGGESVETMRARKATPAELLEHPLIKAVYAAQQYRPSTHTLPGFGTPEFQARREFIIDKKIVRGYAAAVKYLVEVAKAFSTKGSVTNEGIATIVLGPPAAGKSTFSELLAQERHAAIVDPDEAKKIIPEYNGGAGANAVHGESRELAHLVADKLYDEKANLVFPTVGADMNGIREFITELKGLGYRVDVVHIDVAPDEAFRRMIGRYKERLIPLEFFNMVGDKPRQTYNIVKRERLAHEAIEIDANGPPGQHVITDGGDTELASYLRPERRP